MDEASVHSLLAGLEQRMAARIDVLSEKVDDMREKIDGMSARLAQVEGLAIKSRIWQMTWRLNAPTNNFGKAVDEVPFPDGTRPWDCEVDGPDNTRVILPALNTLESIRTLTPPQTYGYVRGYYPGMAVPSIERTRKEMILCAIMNLDD